MERVHLHDTWARILQYPDEESGALDLSAALATLGLLLPELSGTLRPLAERTEQLGASELQEVYARTFDGTAARALEVGWHLFGESYSRGAFLVRMRELLREGGVLEACELPDHLGCVLAVLGRAKEDVAAALVHGSVLPAIDKILTGFDDPEDPYAKALHGLRSFLDTYHPSPAATGAGARAS